MFGITLVSVLVLFYFAIGFGTVIKYSENQNCETALYCIFVLPFQTITYTIWIMSKCIRFAPKELSEDDSSDSGTLRIGTRLRIIQYSFLICIKSMPIISSKLASVCLENRAIKFAYKKARNDLLDVILLKLVCVIKKVSRAFKNYSENVSFQISAVNTQTTENLNL